MSLINGAREKIAQIYGYFPSDSAFVRETTESLISHAEALRGFGHTWESIKDLPVYGEALAAGFACVEQDPEDPTYQELMRLGGEC